MNDELKGKLKELGLTDDQIGKLETQGVATEADMALLNEQEIKDTTECGLITAKKVAAAFAPVAPATPGAATPEQQAAVLDILPVVPDDVSFVEMLKVGGILKITPADVISAIRAAVAKKLHLYELPDILRDRMEQFALEQDEPVGSNFYDLLKMITSRDYAEVLAAIGVSGTFISEKRKNEVLVRLNAQLWPALRGFHNLLVAWSDSWAKGVANPAMAMAAFVMAQGGKGAMLPPGMMQPPDTAGLRDEAEEVINRINKVFAGTGIPVARALAWDAIRIRKILEEPTLPAAVGATTKEQMLKSLGVDVGAGDVRLERNVIRYALAIMELPKVSAGNEEYTYLTAMLMLGGAILWDKLNPTPESSADRKEVRPATAGTPFREPAKSSF